MTTTSTHTHGLPPEDTDIVAGWLIADKTRWIAGVMAGLFAGLVALGFAGVLAIAGGLEFWFPIKIMGSWILGASATELGFKLGAIIAGLVIVEALSAFWGAVYAHFVKTDSLGSLLAMGVVWGTFGWIFHWNLYFHSIKPILAANISPGAVFPVFMVWGMALTVVSFFDRAMRK